jgi:hypothetical protein
MPRLQQKPLFRRDLKTELMWATQIVHQAFDYCNIYGYKGILNAAIESWQDLFSRL